MDDWRSPDVDELIAALLRLEEPDEAARFLRDLCTLGELRDLAQRWSVVRRLDETTLVRNGKAKPVAPVERVHRSPRTG